jgi:hypothetical protein
LAKKNEFYKIIQICDFLARDDVYRERKWGLGVRTKQIKTDCGLYLNLTWNLGGFFKTYQFLNFFSRF